MVCIVCDESRRVESGRCWAARGEATTLAPSKARASVRGVRDDESDDERAMCI
jgi:hypothetical protein